MRFIFFLLVRFVCTNQFTKRITERITRCGCLRTEHGAMRRIHRMHVRSIKSWQSVNLSKHRKQSAPRNGAQAQDKYADTDWHREICFRKMFAILFLLAAAAAAAAAFFSFYLWALRRGIRQSSGLFIADENPLPTNHMVRATRMISVCQLCSVARSASAVLAADKVFTIYIQRNRALASWLLGSRVGTEYTTNCTQHSQQHPESFCVCETIPKMQ